MTPAGERLVRLARWALLALAAGSAVLAVGLARRSAAAAVPWVCPMHPKVRTLAPGAFVDISIAWRFTVPDYGAGRMGRDGTLYEMGQWYPRMVVYDDVRGWNHEPYIGGGEFYLAYGSLDVAITVPAGFTDGGMPVGIELLGQAWSEPRLLSLSHAYEQATHNRRPPASTPALPGER